MSSPADSTSEQAASETPARDMPARETPARSVDEVIELVRTWGVENYDESVTQLDHALQTAALAVAEGAGDALVAAALLHDVGHLLELREGGVGDGDVEHDLAHETRGAAWLSTVFPVDVTEPIASHVAAKRYRCAVDSQYAADLSPGSTASLVRQGGPMTADEVTVFERNRTNLDAVKLRGWDDDGKVDGLDIVPLDAYEPMLRRLSISDRSING